MSNKPIKVWLIFVLILWSVFLLILDRRIDKLEKQHTTTIEEKICYI